MNATLQKIVGSRKIVGSSAAPPAEAEGVEATRPFSVLPTSDEYAAGARRRAWGFLGGGAALAAAVAGAYTALGLDNIILPLVLLVVVLVPLLLWNRPRVALYFVFAAACLFELSLNGTGSVEPYRDALTERIPFFWNVNTIFQIYAHADIHLVPLNLLELFVLLAGVCSTLRAVYSGTARLKGGALFLPISAYIAFVLMAWGNGVGSGGDFKISLQEVRAQFYFLLAYLMAVNMVQERRQVGVLLWIAVLCIGLKGILYTFRRYVTLAGLPLPDQGVGSHEEAFFFDAFAVLLVVLTVCGFQARLRLVMWGLLPFVLTGNLACNRRAATAAMVVLVPLLLMAASQALPQRRRLIGIMSVVLAVGGLGYYSAFKNSDSLLAQPARAIKSNFQPDARDASSNAARDGENANLMATVKAYPLQGIGYGRRYLHVFPMVDISNIYELEDFLPHNQLLWVWERVGTFGFFTFWMMVSAIIIFAGQTLRRPEADAQTKSVAMFALLVMPMLLLFGLLDLQLSNPRDVLFAGVWVGVLAVSPSLDPRLKPLEGRAR